MDSMARFSEDDRCEPGAHLLRCPPKQVSSSTGAWKITSGNAGGASDPNNDMNNTRCASDLWMPKRRCVFMHRAAEPGAEDKVKRGRWVRLPRYRLCNARDRASRYPCGAHRRPWCRHSRQLDDWALARNLVQTVAMGACVFLTAGTCLAVALGAFALTDFVGRGSGMEGLLTDGLSALAGFGAGRLLGKMLVRGGAAELRGSTVLLRNVGRHSLGRFDIPNAKVWMYGNSYIGGSMSAPSLMHQGDDGG